MRFQWASRTAERRAWLGMSVKFIDYYKVLGVDEAAADADIKKAYRRLARKYHPDVSKEANAEDRFKEVNEAYEVLRDKQRRAEYDQLRRYGGHPGEDFRPPPGWHSHAAGGGSSGSGPEAGFSDFFEALFGARGGGRGQASGFSERGFDRAMAGQDSHHRLDVTLEESFNGAQRRLSLHDPSTGQSRSLEVRIPKGVVEGQKIRLRGQGVPGMRGGGAGDLYLEIHLMPHRLFRVEGRDLHLRLPVAPWEAALGADVRVPTLSGPVNLKIPANSRGGRKMRLKGRGIPGAVAGDLIVELQITMPGDLGSEGRELMEKMRDTVKFDPRAELGV
jgi:curved DNA-binding protein